MLWKRKKPEQRPEKKQVIPVAGRVETGETSSFADDFMHKLSPEARARLAAKEKTVSEVLQFTEDDPEAASKLLRIWLAGK
ncbi:MAG: hypothetical protein V3W14_05820 [Candidatus Neomarinimicrobiota bacterium]